MKKLQFNRKEVLKKTIPSLIILIAVTLLNKFVLFKNYDFSFFGHIIVGWILGGFIWGFTLTKPIFPNWTWRKTLRDANASTTVNYTDGTSSTYATTGDTIRMMGAVFSYLIRVTVATVVGVVALPVGIIITIVILIGIGVDKGKEIKAQVDAETQAKAEAETQVQAENQTEAQTEKTQTDNKHNDAAQEMTN